MIKDTEVTITDVARIILEKTGPITTMKLQKLCYYSHVWHCFHLNQKLFKEEVRAWSYGPVIYELFDKHRGKYQLNAAEIDVSGESSLGQASIAVIDQVLAAYGQLSGAQLSDLSHSESPWLTARALMTQGESSPVIEIEKMVEFAASQSAQ